MTDPAPEFDVKGARGAQPLGLRAHVEALSRGLLTGVCLAVGLLILWEVREMFALYGALLGLLACPLAYLEAVWIGRERAWATDLAAALVVFLGTTAFVVAAFTLVSGLTFGHFGLDGAVRWDQPVWTAFWYGSDAVLFGTTFLWRVRGFSLPKQLALNAIAFACLIGGNWLIQGGVSDVLAPAALLFLLLPIEFAVVAEYASALED